MDKPAKPTGEALAMASASCSVLNLVKKKKSQQLADIHAETCSPLKPKYKRCYDVKKEEKCKKLL